MFENAKLRPSLRSLAALLFVAALVANVFFPATPKRRLGASAPGLAALGESLHLEFVTEGPKFPVKMRHGLVDGKAAPAAEIERYLKLFTPEFGLYPPSYVAKSGLKRVIFCQDLSFAGQLRTAIPDWDHDDLYLDVRRGADKPDYVRKVIHHEFFHLVDLRDDGEVYRDDRWSALNPPGFKYGSGGRNAQTVKGTASLSESQPGFLNHYSTTGVEEDKAEIFANLVVDPAYVAGRAARDRVLADKAARMKDLVRRFCPEANDAFWDRARESRIRDDGGTSRPMTQGAGK